MRIGGALLETTFFAPAGRADEHQLSEQQQSVTQFVYAIILKHFAAAAMVFSISASLWVAETKAVSNWEGAR